MKVIQSLSFSKVVKRWPEEDKRILDLQIRAVMDDPGIGREKRGSCGSRWAEGAVSFRSLLTIPKEVTTM